MNKEYIYDLLNRLDLQEWCTELYKVPLTWCELYDIRDYIINLEQTLDEIEKCLKNDIESCNSALSNPEYTIINKHELLKNEKQKDIDILKIIQKAKGDEISGNMERCS